MAETLSEQLSSVFASGSGLQSGSLSVISTSMAALDSMSNSLVTLAASMIPTVVDPVLVLTPLETESQALGGRIQTTYIPILESCYTELGLLTSHIEERLEKLFEELSVASAMTEITAYSDINATINSISGTAFGEVDTVLANADTVLSELELALDGFSIDLVEELTQLTAFELILTQATDTLTLTNSSVPTAISSEVAALSQMYSSYQQHAKAVSAQLLVSNADTGAIVAQLASPELSALLS